MNQRHLVKKLRQYLILKCSLKKYPGEVYIFNLDLIELKSVVAENITETLLSYLNSYGFN